MSERLAYMELLDQVRAWGAVGPEYDAIGVLQLLRAATANLLEHRDQLTLDREALQEVFDEHELAMLEEVIDASRAQ